MKIRGAIFDLDGTLLDSMPIWDTLGMDYLLTQGIQPHEDLFDTIKPMTIRQVAEYFKSEYKIFLSPSEIENGINSMIESYYFYDILPKDGVKEVLQRLKENGIRMCVVTATDKVLAEAALARNGIKDCFEFITTCGDFGSGKDSSAIFEYALEKLSTPKAYTLVFEDAIHASVTAKIAGFPLVVVYDKSFDDNVQELKKLADIYINSWGQLLHLLEIGD